MAFEELKENTEYIKEQVHSYVEHSLAYYKLKFFRVIMKSSVSIMKFVLVSISFLMVLFFCSLALAFALSIYFGSYALGFVSVAGLYTILTLLLFIFKRKLIEGPFLRKCSKMFFNS
ncbi:competence protein [Flavobacterium algicola]|uniref:competence protein n=1 Tax=Flavobacterium algicola TaxID=556529 RepID=UPI001EFD5B58|nr:competence protein [Flavobacterium algicola]MCG9791933.1 competence protein [Flavobacterium algicola]